MSEHARSADRDAPWGAFCEDVHAEMLEHITELDAAIGIDEWAGVDHPPLIKFKHAGEAPVPALRGGASRTQAWGKLVTIAVECWGCSPEDAWDIQRRLELTINALAHGRASKMGKFEAQTGSKTEGNDGAKLIGSFQVRFAVVEQPRRTAAPTAAPSIVATVVAPDGSGGTGSNVVTLK